MLNEKKIKYLIYGPPAAGSLKYIIKEKNLNNQEVISINDDLSYGPLNDINERINFVSTLIDNILPNDQELIKYIESSLNSWPLPKDFENCRIILVHCKNSPEQTMLKMLVKQLQSLDLFEIELDNESISLLGTGAYTPEKLGSYIGTETKISNERKIKLIKEWDNLLLSNSVLRIWKNKSVISVDENYYDDDIIKQCTKDYKNAARITGNVLGNSDQQISDTWINYRIIQLIKNNKLIARGNLKELRLFEICLP